MNNRKSVDFFMINELIGIFIFVNELFILYDVVVDNKQNKKVIEFIA